MRKPAVAVLLAAVIVIPIGLLTAYKLPRHAQILPVAATERVTLTSRPKLVSAGSMSISDFQAPVPSTNATTSLASPQIARSGKVSLLVGNVDSAVSEISRLARREHGDLFALQVDNDRAAAAKASADVRIRIPATMFDDAMQSFGRIGKVRERSVNAEDVSGTITDSTARLHNLRRTEADIRKIMDRSGSVSQVLDAENQLSQVREQIETLESDLTAMRGRVAYATIDASLEAESATTPVEPTISAQLASAWHAAFHALGQTTVALVALLLWLVVFMPYIVGGAAATWLMYARARKRFFISRGRRDSNPQPTSS